MNNKYVATRKYFRIKLMGMKLQVATGWCESEWGNLNNSLSFNVHSELGYSFVAWMHPITTNQRLIPNKVWMTNE